ncbi:MAG TPA: TetR/AcrR family transcriptional regulator [Candidatus Binataceae bacterium]|nr:TetR/AcrR family transcriptional regulator [Candidatus Binataceae bacterium]
MAKRNGLGDQRLSPRLKNILRDLERIIVAEGFLHLDTATLAKRLRCSKRALYTLAPTQEKLLILVIQRVLERTDQYLANSARNPRGWRSALVNYMNAMVITSRPASPRFLRDIAAFAPGMRLLNRLQQRTTHRLEQIIRNGIVARVFNDISPRLVAELILMAAKQLIDPDFLRNLGLNLAEVYEELSRLLEHGLLPQREPSIARGNPHQRQRVALLKREQEPSDKAPQGRRRKAGGVSRRKRQHA